MVCKIKTLLVGLAILTVVQAASVTLSANSDLLTRSDAIIADIRRRILALLEDIDVINHGVVKILSRREEVQNLHQNSTTIEPSEPQAQPPVQPPIEQPAQPLVQPFVQSPVQPSVQQPVQLQVEPPVQYHVQYPAQQPFKPHVQPAYSARPPRPTFSSYG